MVTTTAFDTSFNLCDEYELAEKSLNATPQPIPYKRNTLLIVMKHEARGGSKLVNEREKTEKHSGCGLRLAGLRLRSLGVAPSRESP